MRELSAPQLLEIWECGSAQTATERALTLLAAARPDLKSDALGRLSVGRRDRLLLSLRESTFGRRLAAVTNCPECREQLELAFDIEDVRLPDTTTVPDETATVSIAEYEVRFRLPDSFDLMTAAATGDPNLARDVLRKRCLLSARREAQQIEIERLPAAVFDRVEQEMLKMDGQANIQLELECPACRQGWTAAFDILAFFWSELDAWAQRLLVEVHKLASAYGWSETDILGMSQVRRNLYLNIVNG